MKKIFFALLAISLHANGVSFVDQSGFKINLNKPAQKVATMPMPLASLVISIDKGTHRLVSINPKSKEAIENGILGKIFPDARNLSTKGIGQNFVPNVEELIKLEPDLIFQWGHYGESYVAPLKNAGLNVALMGYGEEEHILEWFRMLGIAFGQEKRVAQILLHREKIKEKIKNLAKNVKKKPKVLYFLRAKSGYQISGKNTYINYSIKLAGGENAVNIESFKEVEVEQILKYNPDIILLNNFDSDLDTSVIYNHKLLSLTKAAQEKRVYKMPLGGYRWDPPSQESPLAWLWLFKIMHLDEAKFSLKDEMKKAYNLLYGYELSDEDIKNILHYEINKNSKAYEALLR